MDSKTVTQATNVATDTMQDAMKSLNQSAMEMKDSVSPIQITVTTAVMLVSLLAYALYKYGFFTPVRFESSEVGPGVAYVATYRGGSSELLSKIPSLWKKLDIKHVYHVEKTTKGQPFVIVWDNPCASSSGHASRWSYGLMYREGSPTDDMARKLESAGLTKIEVPTKIPTIRANFPYFADKLSQIAIFNLVYRYAYPAELKRRGTHPTDGAPTLALIHLDEGYAEHHFVQTLKLPQKMLDLVKDLKAE